LERIKKSCISGNQNIRGVVHLEIIIGEELRIYMLIAESSESERQSKRRVEDLENKVGDRLKGNQCRAERRVGHEKRDRKNPVSGNWGGVEVRL
jgi:hypothetical protein